MGPQTFHPEPPADRQTPLLDPADQHRRAIRFRRLHEGSEPFVVANAWDAGSACMLTQVGFAALATTSAGLAFALGRPDGANRVSRDETLANARAIVAATHLPVSADLESGYGETAEELATTIRLAADAGLVGGSIEDATGDPDHPIHPFDSAVERVAAAAATARELPFAFTLTARAENYLYGRPDLDDTIRRLRAFEAVGADVLYAPSLPDQETIRTVCASVGRPVNVLARGSGLETSVFERSARAACGGSASDRRSSAPGSARCCERPARSTTPARSPSAQTPCPIRISTS